MVIDMNEAQVRTLEQLRQVLAGTQAMEFQAAAVDDKGRYAWIESVLRRFEYRRLPRADRGPVLAYLQRLSGYSRAQITRLVSRWDAGKPLVKNYGTPRCPFARRYTPADVALLVDVDRAMGTLSGPATACVLRRQRDVFGDERFVRLGSISVGHLYNLRHSAGYRNQRVLLTKTQPSKNTKIGVRKAPAHATIDAAAWVNTLPVRSTSRIALWMAAALVLTPAVGMLASIGVMTAGLAHAFGERRWQVILLIGAGTAIGLYVVLESTLRIMFPRGAFG